MLIESVDLGKRYGRRTWGLRGCSLTIPEGSVTGLVGPNGAGKTTFLLLTAGLIAPTTGKVTVLGRSPSDSKNLLPDLGFVGQNHPLHGRFRVSDVLRMGSALNDRWDSSVFEKRMDTHRIPLDQRVDTLSGGQRAQVALALALAKRPRLMLLDEPVAALDPLARREFLETLSESVDRFKLSVVISSHLIEDVKRVCDRLILLSAAHLQLNGDIATLLAAHRLVPSADATRAADAGHLVIGPRGRNGDDEVVVLIRGTFDNDGFASGPISLEELILAYMNAPALTTLDVTARQSEKRPPN